MLAFYQIRVNKSLFGKNRLRCERLTLSCRCKCSFQSYCRFLWSSVPPKENDLSLRFFSWFGCGQFCPVSPKFLETSRNVFKLSEGWVEIKKNSSVKYLERRKKMTKSACSNLYPRQSSLSTVHVNFVSSTITLQMADGKLYGGHGLFQVIEAITLWGYWTSLDAMKCVYHWAIEFVQSN